MSKTEKDKDMKSTGLPQNEVFEKKEVYQHPQPADQGLPLEPDNKKKPSSTLQNEKEENKTSKTEGLNEEKSAGDAGAFEGLEDQNR